MPSVCVDSFSFHKPIKDKISSQESDPCRWNWWSRNTISNYIRWRGKRRRGEVTETKPSNELYDGISTVLEKYFEEEKCSLDISDDNFSERNDTNQSRSPSLNDLGGDEDETAAIRDEDETSANGDEFVDVSAHVEETGAASNKRGKRKEHLVTRRCSLRRKNLKKSNKEGSKE